MKTQKKLKKSMKASHIKVKIWIDLAYMLHQSLSFIIIGLAAV